MKQNSPVIFGRLIASVAASFTALRKFFVAHPPKGGRTALREIVAPLAFWSSCVRASYDGSLLFISRRLLFFICSGGAAPGDGGPDADGEAGIISSVAGNVPLISNALQVKQSEPVQKSNVPLGAAGHPLFNFVSGSQDADRRLSRWKVVVKRKLSGARILEIKITWADKIRNCYREEKRGTPKIRH